MDNPRVAVVSRGGAERFAAVFDALRAAGLSPEPCIYDEAREREVRAQLLACAAVLVFVNPLQDGRRRHGLDAILREAAKRGVRLGAHPDVVDRMGVKAVLWRTRDMGWGSDVRFYETRTALASGLVATLAAGPRVLKPNRGNGGQGVWKVEAAGEGRVVVQAAAGETAPRVMILGRFIADRQLELDAAGGMVDQAFQPRLTEGMVRCYMSGGRCAGFGAQKVRMLAPKDAPSGPRLYSGPSDPRFQRLRGLMEDDWAPALCRTLDIAPQELPAIWDADFLLGPPDHAGADSHVLCEINASSVFPMPDEAPGEIARTLRDRLA